MSGVLRRPLPVDERPANDVAEPLDCRTSAGSADRLGKNQPVTPLTSEGSAVIDGGRLQA